MLLTGSPVEYQTNSDNRATAPIANIFAPVIPETSTTGLTLLRDATHGGTIDHLQATYLGRSGSEGLVVGRLTNFNSESTQTGVCAGIRPSIRSWREDLCVRRSLRADSGCIRYPVNECVYREYSEWMLICK